MCTGVKHKQTKAEKRKENVWQVRIQANFTITPGRFDSVAHTASYDDDDNELHDSCTSHYLSWLSTATVPLAHLIRTMWV